MKPSDNESQEENKLLQIKSDNLINGMYLHRHGLFATFQVKKRTMWLNFKSFFRLYDLIKINRMVQLKF